MECGRPAVFHECLSYCTSRCSCSSSQAGLTTNCYTDSEWDTSVCPDGETCGKNCTVGAVPTADWAGTYGVAHAGNGVSVPFVTQGFDSVKHRVQFVADAPEGDLFRC